MHLQLLKRSKLLRYFISFSFLLLGIAIGIAIRHYYNIPLSESINIIDVAMLITTVFLAVYVPSVLDRQAQTNRDKSDLIETRVGQLQDIYSRINLAVQKKDSANPDCEILGSLLDICDHKIETINKLIEYFGEKDAYKKEIDEIKLLNGKYKFLLISSVSPDKGYVYDPIVAEQEEALYNKIDMVTSLLMFKINDA